jgi:CheY-like chemotaxis protein
MSGILVIDDDAANRAMFARALRDVAAIETADGGAEAIAKLKEKKFDVVLLDLHMPGVDGVDVLDSMSPSDSINHGTPVYVITADTSDEMRKRVMGLGAACVVTKPVQLATLVSFVKTTIQTKKASGTLTPGGRRS